MVSNPTRVNALTSGGSMRRSFTVCSIVVHALVIATVLIAQVLAVGPLPTLRQVVMFDASRIMPVDIQVPAPPRRPVPAEAASPIVSPDAAPLVPPIGVIKETGNENVVAPSVDVIRDIEIVPRGVIDGTGFATVALPPPPPPTVPARLHAGMKAPKKIVNVDPLYPAIAQSARVQGVVILEAVLDANGRVDSVHVLRSIPLLDQAAVDAVRQWRFTPALLNNEAVPVVMTVTVNFALQ
jgi:periplasmic protein TonB